MAQQVTALEAHGTGTALGDPIETGAVAVVFLAQCSTNALVIGSLKANAGHTEPGAGLAGALKLLMQLHFGDMPPNAQLRVLNPHVGGGMCDHSAYLLPMQVEGMSQREQGEVGGVSSFGYSGTIAHAVLWRGASEAWILPPAAPAIYRRHAFQWANPPHPFAQHRLSISDSSDYFRSSAAGWLLALVSDHIVQGRVIFPGAGYLEMARAALTVGGVLHAIFFLQPLALEAPGLHTECTVADGRFEVRSGAFVADDGALEDTVVHCSGGVALAPDDSWQRVEHAKVRGGACPHAALVTALYDGFDAVGLQYGPRFRTLTQVWGGNNVAAARLQSRVMREGTAVHPADLDDALCVTMLALSWADSGETRLPFAVDHAWLRDGMGELWAVRCSHQSHPPSCTHACVLFVFTGRGGGGRRCGVS
jgi:acyl transferase domain-containing protein